MNNFEITIAEKILINIPNINVNAKALIKLVPKKYKIKATIKVVKFPSLIDDHARLKPFSTLNKRSLLYFRSSLILEKINILASTAIPIDKTIPPIPAKVNVTGINLIRANKIIQ